MTISRQALVPLALFLPALARDAFGQPATAPCKGGPGEINAAITFAGMVAEPGDLVLGDAGGVLSMPFDAVATVLTVAKAKQTVQEREMAGILAGTSDRAWVLRTLRDRGCKIEA